MGHYAYETKDATTFIDMSGFELVEDIKNAVRMEKWNCYGWRNDVLKAETVEEIANVFNIKLVDEEDGYCRPVIDCVYVSHFFSDLIKIVAPYMTDGVIEVDDEYNIVTITFENGKSKVERM